MLQINAVLQMLVQFIQSNERKTCLLRSKDIFVPTAATTMHSAVRAWKKVALPGSARP